MKGTLSLSFNRSSHVGLILFAMSTAFSFAVSDRQMNYVLVGLMGFVPILLIRRFPFFQKKEIVIYLLYTSIVISALYNYNSFRISTILYTLMFLLTYIYFTRLISNSNFSLFFYKKILVFLIGAYFVTLLLQQVCVLLDFPFIFNFIAGTQETFKLNSLSPEPSHSARILTVLMYSFIVVRELELNRAYNLFRNGWHDRFIWLIFAFQMISMGSGFAIVFLILILVKVIEIRKVIYLIPTIMLLLVTLPLLTDLVAVNRVMKFGTALITLNIEQIMKTDHSASVRVIPSFLYVINFSLNNIHTWLGFGTDYAAFRIPELMPGIPDGGYRAGLFPSFFMDRGIISAILLIIVIIRNCIYNIISFETLLLFVLIFAAGINTQLFWISILLFTTNKYFIRHYKISNNTCINE